MTARAEACTIPGTAGAAVDFVTRRLADVGIETARLDARILVANVLAIDPARVFSHPEAPLDTPEREALSALLGRREAREPVARIVGEKEFWSLPFVVTTDTLVPRPETETVVEAVLDLHPDRTQPLRVLDLGTGSGCLLVAILMEYPNAEGVGTDCSEGALAAARRNADRNDVGDRARFQLTDWCAGLDPYIGAGFDIVVSNPPYIAEAEIDSLAPEVSRYEPRAALAAGTDGLDAYRSILEGVIDLMTAGAAAVFEVGAGQAADVGRMARAHGLETIGVKSDLAGIERVVVLGAAVPDAGAG